jgi:hypothetical protein
VKSLRFHPIRMLLPSPCRHLVLYAAPAHSRAQPWLAIATAVLAAAPPPTPLVGSSARSTVSAGEGTQPSPFRALLAPSSAPSRSRHTGNGGGAQARRRQRIPLSPLAQPQARSPTFTMRPMCRRPPDPRSSLRYLFVDDKHKPVMYTPSWPFLMGEIEHQNPNLSYLDFLYLDLIQFTGTHPKVYMHICTYSIFELFSPKLLGEYVYSAYIQQTMVASLQPTTMPSSKGRASHTSSKIRQSVFNVHRAHLFSSSFSFF